MQLDPAVEEALADPLLSASIWVMIALMGLAIVLFVYMGRNVTDDRVRLMFAATIGIPAVSIASYLGLASGLTVGVVDIPGAFLEQPVDFVLCLLDDVAGFLRQPVQRFGQKKRVVQFGGAGGHVNACFLNAGFLDADAGSGSADIAAQLTPGP